MQRGHLTNGYRRQQELKRHCICTLMFLELSTPRVHLIAFYARVTSSGSARAVGGNKCDVASLEGQREREARSFSRGVLIRSGALAHALLCAKRRGKQWGAPVCVYVCDVHARWTKIGRSSSSSVVYFCPVSCMCRLR